MHEFAITRQVLDIVLEEARSAGLKRVRQVSLTLGRLRGFMPDAIRMYFDILSEGTPASGAVLQFTEVAPRFQCRECRHTFSVDFPTFVCPACESFLLDTLAGTEFTIDAIDGDGT